MQLSVSTEALAGNDRAHHQVRQRTGRQAARHSQSQLQTEPKW